MDPGPALHSDPSSVLPARVCRTPRYAGSIWGDQQAQRQLNFSLNGMTFDSAAFLLVRGMGTASPGRSGTHERNLSPIFPVEKLGQRVPIPVPSLLATPSPSLLSLWISKKNPDLNGEGLASAAHSLCGPGTKAVQSRCPEAELRHPFPGALAKCPASSRWKGIWSRSTQTVIRRTARRSCNACTKRAHRQIC